MRGMGMIWSTGIHGDTPCRREKCKCRLRWWSLCLGAPLVWICVVSTCTFDMRLTTELGRWSGDIEVDVDKLTLRSSMNDVLSRANVPTFLQLSESASLLRVFVTPQHQIQTMLATAWVCRSCLSSITRPLIRRQLRHKSSREKLGEALIFHG